MATDVAAPAIHADSDGSVLIAVCLTGSKLFSQIQLIVKYTGTVSPPGQRTEQVLRVDSSIAKNPHAFMLGVHLNRFDTWRPRKHCAHQL